MYIGVIDGNLPGLDLFGIYQSHLPRVIVTEGFDEWVEDHLELTVSGLPGDLEKLPRLWRMRAGLVGKLIWIARQSVRSYFEGEQLAQSIAGPTAGRCLYIGLLASGVFLYIRYFFFPGASRPEEVEDLSDDKKVK